MQGFTLIELLIVVAIIAILAAIAVPNFLEAQVRAKVSATKADIKAIVLALESYRVDHDDYPWYPSEAQDRTDGAEGANNPFLGMTPPTLTTPLAYLTMLPHDEFEYGVNSYTILGDGKRAFFNPFNLYNYTGQKQYNAQIDDQWTFQAPGVTWVIVGKGPDLEPVCNEVWNLHGNMPEYFTFLSGSSGIHAFYDPTNGTVSWGDIVCYGPGAQFELSYYYSY
jgi:type II secretion system protein G